MSAPYRVTWSDGAIATRTEHFATIEAAHEAFYAKRAERCVVLDRRDGCTWRTLYRLDRIAELWAA